MADSEELLMKELDEHFNKWLSTKGIVDKPSLVLLYSAWLDGFRVATDRARDLVRRARTARPTWE